MNLDDLLCVGATGPILLSSTIGRNKHLITGEVIKAIIQGTEELLEELRGHELTSAAPVAKRPTSVTWCGRSLSTQRLSHA